LYKQLVKIELLDSRSLVELLSDAYPDFGWLPWRFAHCPHNYWDDMKNRRKFMDWAAKELKIKEKSDWYKVTQKVFFFQIEKILK
jgi:hypothetical protein